MLESKYLSFPLVEEEFQARAILVKPEDLGSPQKLTYFSENELEIAVPHIHTVAVIDTGATNTSIPLEFAEQLNLTKINNAEYSLADSVIREGYEYSAVIVIARQFIKTISVLGIKNSCEILVGIDFLKNHAFHYDPLKKEIIIKI